MLDDQQQHSQPCEDHAYTTRPSAEPPRDPQSLSEILTSSVRPEDKAIMRGMRVALDPEGHLRTQRAEDAMSAPWSSYSPRRREAAIARTRRRGVSLGIFDDRPHVMFPLTDRGRETAKIVASMDADEGDSIR